MRNYQYASTTINPDFLNHVVGLGHAAQHPAGDTEKWPAMLIEDLDPGDPTKPGGTWKLALKRFQLLMAVTASVNAN